MLGHDDRIVKVASGGPPVLLGYRRVQWSQAAAWTRRAAASCRASSAVSPAQVPSWVSDEALMPRLTRQAGWGPPPGRDGLSGSPGRTWSGR